MPALINANYTGKEFSHPPFSNHCLTSCISRFLKSNCSGCADLEMNGAHGKSQKYSLHPHTNEIILPRICTLLDTKEDRLSGHTLNCLINPQRPFWKHTRFDVSLSKSFTELIADSSNFFKAFGFSRVFKFSLAALPMCGDARVGGMPLLGTRKQRNKI